MIQGKYVEYYGLNLANTHIEIIANAGFNEWVALWQYPARNHDQKH